MLIYKVANAIRAVANVDDYSGSARLLAATTLRCVFARSAYFVHFVCFVRNVLGTKTLGDILSDRESIALEMQTVLDEGTEPWGVKVERVEVVIFIIIITICHHINQNH